jgi:hypothetical protein
MRNESLGDHAVIPRNAAAFFFGIGKDRFEKRWNEHYKYIIRHVETTGGLRLLLTDVVEAAFPDATDQTVHIGVAELLVSPERPPRADRPDADFYVATGQTSEWEKLRQRL